MAYREPGVRLTVVAGTLGTNASSVNLIPLIVGGGPKMLEEIASVVRGSSNVDTLPYTSINSIVSISSRSGGPTEWEPTVDYAFSAAESTITWAAGRGPAAGETYFIDLIYNVVDEEHFEVKTITSISECVAAYGDDILTIGGVETINKLSTAIQIALQSGAPYVYAVQVPSAGDTPTSQEYQVALEEKVAFVEEAWRIINVDTSSEINAVIQNHVTQMSSVEERKERTAFFGTPYDSERPTQFDGDTGVLSTVGGYAEALKDMRTVIIYPDRATYSFSDGERRVVDSPMLYAAIAGMEMSLPVQQPRTRKSINIFSSLVGVKMSNSQKTTLAGKGVTVLEQSQVGAPAIIRHGITTNMDTVQSREMSLVAIRDYASKFYREVLDVYIGEIINTDLIRRISGSVITTSSAMIRSGILNDADNPVVTQNVENPDRIDVSVSVLPPYPSNYIDIVMYFDATPTTTT